jgi:hypothetical protein
MTSRPSGVLRLLVGLAAVCSRGAAAQDSGSSSVGVVSILRTGSASFSGSNSSNSSGSDDNEAAAYIARGYASTMGEDEQRLTIMRDSLLTESVCDGEPMVILKSTSVPANGACLPAQSSYNLSCSCLSGFANATAWTFRIRSPETRPTSPFPTTISDGVVIYVDSLMLYDIPSSVLILFVHSNLFVVVVSCLN